MRVLFYDNDILNDSHKYVVFIYDTQRVLLTPRRASACQGSVLISAPLLVLERKWHLHAAAFLSPKQTILHSVNFSFPSTDNRGGEQAVRKTESRGQSRGSTVADYRMVKTTHYWEPHIFKNNMLLVTTRY